MCFPLWKKLSRSTIVKLYNKRTFSFVRNGNLLSKVVVPFYIPMSNEESSCGFTFLPTFDGVSVLDFDNSTKHVVVSPYCFNLHFPDDK